MRIAWVDVAKGIAIILVVIGHVISAYYAAGQYLDSALFNFSDQFIYSFHMALFMLLSGLVFRTSENRKNQVKKILINRGVVYITFSFLWWIFKMVLNPFINSPLKPEDILLIPIFPISFMWFIYALLIMEIVQVFLGKLSVKGKIAQIVVSVVLLFVRAGISGHELFNTGHQFSDFIFSDVMRFWLYFSMGTCFGKDIVAWIEKRAALSGIGGGILLIGGNILLYRVSLLDNVFYRFILAVAGILFLITVGHRLQRIRLIQYLGQHTLPIYVLQGWCIAATRIILGNLHLNDASGIIPMVLCTIAGIVIPLLIYEAAQRIGRIDFFFTPGKYINIEGK